MKKLASITGFLLVTYLVIGQIAPEKVLTVKKHQVWCLSYSDDGKYIASGGNDGAIIVYKIGTYNEVARFEGLKDIPLAVCFSHDGKKLAAAGKDKRITIWNAQSKQLLFQLKGHKDAIRDLEFSPDDKLIASASYDKTIKLWNVNSGTLKSTLSGHKKQVISISFSPNGDKLISGSGDKTVKIWDVKTSNIILNIPAHTGWVRSVAYSPDGSLIASAGDDRQIHLWDAFSGKMLNTFLGHKNWIMSLVFSPDGNYLLSGAHDNLIILTDLRNGKIMFQSAKQSDKILTVAFNPNGETFAFAALFDEDMQVWNARKLNIKPLDRKVAQKESSKSGMIPKIEWITPATSISTNEASGVVKVKINSESSLRKIELYVNSVLFSSKDRAELMMETAENNITIFEELVILNEGKNTIQVKAKNIVGEASSKLINVNYSSVPIELMSWLQPSTPVLEVSQPQFEVKANINKSGSAQQVTVMINGNAVGTHSVPDIGGKVTQNVNLNPGDNIISFIIKTSLYTKEAETRTIKYTPALKPAIAWVNPMGNTLSYISAINLKANITSKIPIDKVEIQVNGLAIYTKRFLEENTFVIDKNIQVTSGQNRIVIIASNKTGESISQQRVITYQAPEKTNISWISPASNTDMFTPSIELKACIQSKSDVSSIKIYNNDALIYSEDNPVANQTGECTIELAKSTVLNQGENIFKIETENSAGVTSSEFRKINYVIPQLAAINWIEPNSAKFTSTDKNFKLKACITSNTPIIGIDLIANSQIISLVPTQQNNQSECTYDLEQIISLNSGNNTVFLKVKNIAGEAVSDILFIDHKAANPYKFALVIGNEDYSSYQTGIDNESNVDFAKNDAAEFKKLCLNYFGIKEEKILYLEDATNLRMNKVIFQLSKLIKASEGKAEVIVFYAGHGFPDEKTKEPFLIPVDVTGSDLAFGAGIKLSGFYEKLTEYPAKRITVFLDACFSGGARNQGLVAARGIKIVPKEVKQAVKKNLIVFAASSGNESSLPYKEKKHGMFTYYLLKKLNETNGNISYKELSDYLKYEVNVNSLLINSKEQHSQTNVSPEVGDKWKTWRFN